ncbi:DUF4350 domain-containing protein [Paenarthrobacter aurescens]|uniref:DUF4350 domain-containing protein n=1 Tax=Paenarthrobacter aurescens TaxID=43663 RepID=A0A4Y3NHX1_PAEAU|nr:DUF4350 domain-containing protein [Paenarthrobacter aurescens]MDO6144123.1 DUF4350 domain-containing protein [Paenarthrobacter aurescens]MDO6147970.1 DUF4350 domain-containing protein [Paenarthrobacter aurescens]MDO6159214.1 DUF4350 domain-containing protein [Paenarthrobacter aurescens]MDO6163198.1 DUF4350 domain-containing protein [Paenarthrobacter aurescens]GEB18319.1 hypothetical protein AAU01_10740 [Paenarthrobacter aurescens]
MSITERVNQEENTDAGLSSGQGFRAWFRKNLVWIALAAVLAALVTFLAIDNVSGATDSRRLSARNPAPDGGMAVAEILGRQGVTVTPTETFEDTLKALSSKDEATVLLYDAQGFLDRSQLEEITAAADRVVVVTPRLRTLNGLTEGIRPGGVVPEITQAIEPGCEQVDALEAGRVSAQGSVFSGPVVCYSPQQNGPGLYAESADGRVTVLGSRELVDNQHLALEGNAALALRTLGNNPDLVWYIPGVGDVPASDSSPTLNELAPRWLAFAGPWLGFVALLAILWRGRRMGPLVFEPLPVVVKAAETAEGRARLYQDSRAVELAARNLRAGTMSRLARHFNLGPDATTQAIVDATARHVELPATEVRSVLIDFTPQSEGQLVLWAQQIERIEQEAIAR